MSEGVFEMPYSLVKEDIEKSFKSKWKALRKLHKQRLKSDDLVKKTEGTAKNSTYDSAHDKFVSLGKKATFSCKIMLDCDGIRYRKLAF